MNIEQKAIEIFSSALINDKNLARILKNYDINKFKAYMSEESYVLGAHTTATYVSLILTSDDYECGLGKDCDYYRSKYKEGVVMYNTKKQSIINNNVNSTRNFLIEIDNAFLQKTLNLMNFI